MTYNDSYTFLNKSELSTTLQPDRYQDDLQIDEKTGTENLDEIYKKKKDLTNEDFATLFNIEIYNISISLIFLINAEVKSIY